MGLTDVFLGRRIRQNHALEHATITLLAERIPGLAVSARSTMRGFTIYGDLDLHTVRMSCEEALKRLHDGEAELAIHPNCGTNLAVGASLAMLGSFFALTATRPRTHAGGLSGGQLSRRIDGRASARRGGAAASDDPAGPP
jgi:hypothetical protein